MTYEDLLAAWPLVLSVEDCYIPEIAAPLIAGLRGLDDESCAVTINLWAMEATGEVYRS
jgi:hypothetical protein